LSNLSADYEIRFLTACLEKLEAYLLSNDIYQALSIRATARHKPYPQFTLGWMLLFQIRAKARALSTAEHAQIDQISVEMDRIRTKWRAAWGRKASQEFSARLNLWRDFLMEFHKNPEGNIDRFEYEVSRRVLLELLQSDADNLISAEVEALQRLDDLLKAIFEADDFIWDQDLRTSFPRSSYWFLYGRPKPKFSF
jgi:hypothetical protein